jgi:hypothetical protein
MHGLIRKISQPCKKVPRRQKFVAKASVHDTARFVRLQRVADFRHNTSEGVERRTGKICSHLSRPESEGRARRKVTERRQEGKEDSHAHALSKLLMRISQRPLLLPRFDGSQHSLTRPLSLKRTGIPQPPTVPHLALLFSPFHTFSLHKKSP